MQKVVFSGYKMLLPYCCGARCGLLSSMVSLFGSHQVLAIWLVELGFKFIGFGYLLPRCQSYTKLHGVPRTSSSSWNSRPASTSASGQSVVSARVPRAPRCRSRRGSWPRRTWRPPWDISVIPGTSWDFKLGCFSEVFICYLKAS